MKKAFKWLALAVAGLLLLGLAVIVILPRIIGVERYKPWLEERVTAATGRPFSIDGQVSLSLFPRTRLTFADLRLGNPPGFEHPDLLAMQFFECQVQLIPLLSGEIAVDRFRVNGLRLVLEQNEAGRGGWEGLGAGPGLGGDRPAAEPADRAPESGTGPPIRSLRVAEFAVSDAAVLWVDHRSGQRRELSGIDLTLTDLSLDRPIGIALAARIDGRPIALRGSLGPLGEKPGQGRLPLDLTLSALDTLQVDLSGAVTDPGGDFSAELKVTVPTFSPRRLADAAGIALPAAGMDPAALDKLGITAAVLAEPDRLRVTAARVELDDTRADLTATVRRFARPEVRAEVRIDQIDLDRYLPAKTEAAAPPAPAPPPESAPAGDPYAPLRELILDAVVKADRLTFRRLAARDLQLTLSARDGVLHMDPAAVGIAGGRVSATAAADVSRARPTVRLDVTAEGIQAGPLLQAFARKDFLEGTGGAAAELSFSGDRPADIKKSLDGTVELMLENGAVKGVDLAALMRSAENLLDFTWAPGSGARTAFSELRAPFVVAAGVARTDGATLTSPLLALTATGAADLVRETLDFRVQSQAAFTSGSGKKTDIRIPILVGGTFDNPLIAPDVKAAARDQIEKRVFESERFKEAFGKEELKPFEEATKGLLRNILPR